MVVTIFRKLLILSPKDSVENDVAFFSVALLYTRMKILSQKLSNADLGENN